LRNGKYSNRSPTGSINAISRDITSCINLLVNIEMGSQEILDIANKAFDSLSNDQKKDVFL
jgi:hypothetical protein